MSDDEDRKALATRVVDATYGPLFDRQFKLPDDMSEAMQEKFSARQRQGLDKARKAYIDLYAKHMDREQLEYLLDFHESDMGRAVKEAQKRIHEELSQALKKSGVTATVRTRDLLRPGD